MPLKLAIFDFDQTLSTCHVYYALSGGDGGVWVPPPYARTESGQLTRLAELDAQPEFAAQGGFAYSAFGGTERVEQLKAFMEELHSSGVECIVCSRGLVGPIQRCLDKVGLLGFFKQIFANVGNGTNPTEYDLHLPLGAPGADARYLGGAANSGWGSKRSLIAKCLLERGLQSNEAVFVDDTPSEVDSARGTCEIVQVQPPTGMGPREFELMRQLLRGASSATPPRPTHNSSVRAYSTDSAVRRIPREESGASESSTPRQMNNPWAAQQQHALVQQPTLHPTGRVLHQNGSFPQTGSFPMAGDRPCRSSREAWREESQELRNGPVTPVYLPGQQQLPEPPPPPTRDGHSTVAAAALPAVDDFSDSPPPPPPPPPRREPETALSESRYRSPGRTSSPGRTCRSEPWTPCESTLPEDVPQTPVCCWLQASTAASQYRRGAVGGPPGTAAPLLGYLSLCSLQ